jgi:hypothetical protein
LKKYFNVKPTVVLEHLRSSSALPLLVGAELLDQDQDFEKSYGAA